MRYPIVPDLPRWLKQRIEAPGENRDSAILSAQANAQTNTALPQVAALFSGWSVTVQAAAEAYQPPMEE